MSNDGWDEEPRRPRRPQGRGNDQGRGAGGRRDQPREEHDPWADDPWAEPEAWNDEAPQRPRPRRPQPGERNPAPRQPRQQGQGDPRQPRQQGRPPARRSVQQPPQRQHSAQRDGLAPERGRDAPTRRPARPAAGGERRPTRRPRPSPERRDYARPEFYERWDPATYEPLEINPNVARARDAGEWVLVIVVAGLFALFVQAFALQAFYIPSESMLPTLRVDDRVLVNKLIYRVSDIDKGDVVVFERPPGETDASIEDLIKRVVATGGDTVSAQNGILYVNGKPLDESYLPANTVTDNLAPITVPPGHLFVMGDNRGNSSDSRVFGPIDEDLVVGQAFMRILPITSVKFL